MTYEYRVDPGTVYLVGAGPGDPGLITAKGLACLESADAVVFDRLASDALISRARSDAVMIDVGKVPGRHRYSQDEINALLVATAREGKSVVRLKGGDPFVFGRGGEEASVLAEACVPFEVVPGVSSAIAAPAYAGIPITNRGYASSFTVVTGSEYPGKPEASVDWEQMARTGGTITVLMGREGLGSIASALVRGGRSPQTPVALVEWGTHPVQRTVVGDLSDIAERADDAGLGSPMVAVVGEVVGLRDRLRWFDKRPLFGKRVLVTRTRTQASTLTALLAREGAWPIEVPTIEVRPVEDTGELDEAVRSAAKYDWVVFTSTNAVDAVFERLNSMGLDARSFGGARVAVIGPATARSLRSRDIVADIVASQAVSESLFETMPVQGGDRVLLPGAASRRDALSKGLVAAGAVVHEVTAYTTVTPDDVRERIERALDEGVDIVTFTSSSTVTNLMAAIDGDADRLGDALIACIGPITAATVGEAGLEVDILAGESSVAGLVDAIGSYYAEGGPANE
jgi:uroporphyrinogen III methyltransferase/synthase